MTKSLLNRHFKYLNVIMEFLTCVYSTQSVKYLFIYLFYVYEGSAYMNACMPKEGIRFYYMWL